MAKFNVNEKLVVIYILFFIAAFVSSCRTNDQISPGTPSAALPVSDLQERHLVDKDTLYHALGGNSGLEELTTEFIIQLAADDRVRHHYAKTDIGRFHHMMKMYVCELSNGPCVYTGDNMKRTHGGMNISSSEFNAVVEALMRAMDTVGLNPGVQNRLLAIFAPLRDDVVGQ